ncbi:uncharacterized protein LOC132186701 [Corylus avellana]|uniref:uncharacterized protein LOC132186701 n=1 Tax=Corylus avellana TaxID=13451 RepID=UPI001E226524|nr:uncharacterized protein LOC132186701 [Corylus avellana]XP_059456702.1 uncharacterized protein LOC132186701 [Corylus avellana]
MGKLWVEVCLISARGLRRSSSLWKLQWFAVGWIDPNNKYCTKIDASGNANPVWKTKFAALVDDSQTNFQDLALHVEVYSREPIFLRERLQGTASVVLKEFLAKQVKNNEGSRPVTEEVGSYQLRKGNSSKPQGFVDISIRISEERGGEPTSYIGNEEGFVLTGHSNNNITLASHSQDGPALATQPPPILRHRQENQFPSNSPYTHPMPYPTNYSNPSVGGPRYPPAGAPSYPPPRTPPPPPPPSNVGYMPTFLPRTDRLSETYINMPPSGRGGGPGPGFGIGLGAGALAAGAVIFGDDFMSGFDVPAGLQDASLTISTDPPF